MNRKHLRISGEKAGGDLLPAFSFGLVRCCLALLCVFLGANLGVCAKSEREVGNRPVPLAQSPGEALHLSLQDCVNIALRENLGLLNQKDSLLSVKSQLIIEKNKFEPNLNTAFASSVYNSHLVQDYENFASLSLAQRHKYGGSFSLTSSLDWIDHTSDYYTGSQSTSDLASPGFKSQFTSSLQFSVSQQLLKGAFWRAATAPLREAKFDVAIARMDLQDQILDLSLSVKQAFYALLKSQEYVVEMGSALAKSKEDVKIARLRLTEGLSSRLDYARAELALVNRQRDLATAKKGFQSAVDNLVEIMGLKIGTKVQPVSDIRRKRVPIHIEQWVETALYQRPDLKAIRAQLDKNKVAEESAKNNTLPTLEAQGSVTMSETDDRLRQTLDVTDRVWQFSLKFEHTFFDVSDSERWVQSRIASRQLARTLEDTKRQVEVSIRELARQLKRLSDDIDALKLAEKIASEQLELSRLSYKEGLINNRDLIAAENDYTVARIDHIRATYDYLSTVAKLDRTLGR